MPWSTALSVGGSLLGGALGGSGSGKAIRAQKDAMAAVQRQQDNLKRQANLELGTYKESGESANNLLSQYLGIANPEGYAKRPERQTYADQIASEYQARYGGPYHRGADMAGLNLQIDDRYNKALEAWEAGKEQYIQNNPGSQGDGRLLREFTNEDFVKDPGHNFRLSEGEKGANRIFAARGGLNSGAALKALARYQQDYASNEFTNAFNRDAANKQSIYSFLSNTAGAGQNAVGTGLGVQAGAAGQIGQAAQNTANNIGQIQVQNSTNQANALQGAIGNLIYGVNRPKNASVVSGGYSTYGTPPFNPTSSKPWYLE